MNFRQFNYQLGCKQAEAALGITDAGGFAGFAQNDPTVKELEASTRDVNQTISDKPPNWSGGASLEAGDTSTSNYNIGFMSGGSA